jgi:hypothetical protein
VSGAPEPVWLVTANVVLWRRYGDLGQELRPGTKAYRGGAKVYVVGTYPGTGHQQLTTVGRGRHTGHWITIDTGVRHLHTFRARLVCAPAVLTRCDGGGLAPGRRPRSLPRCWSGSPARSGTRTTRHRIRRGVCATSA